MHRFSAFILACFSWMCLASTPAWAGGSRVLILGDSLSAAYNIPIEDSWPRLLARQLADRGVDIINASISGETTGGGRSRLPALLQRHRPDILILELGGNDGLRGQPFARTRDNLAAMIKQARDTGARVLLIGVRLPPNLGPAYNRRFQKIYEDLATATGVAYLPHFLEGIAASDPGLMQSDGIHPTARAQSKLAARVRKALEPLLDGD